MLTIKGYLEQMKEKGMAFAQCSYAVHSIYAATVPAMYRYLPYPQQLGVRNFAKFILPLTNWKSGACQTLL